MNHDQRCPAAHGGTNCTCEPGASDRAAAAVATLERMGYTHTGGVEWRPPYGPAPAWLDNRSPREHELKTDPAPFEAVAKGWKTHEIRKNDRNFKVGDRLRLRETEHTGYRMSQGAPLQYTGREAIKIVSHIQTGYGLLADWCILSFAYIGRPA